MHLFSLARHKRLHYSHTGKIVCIVNVRMTHIQKNISVVLPVKTEYQWNHMIESN